jgi:hypothetical protein
MGKKRRVKKMSTATKPIRPTKVNFESSTEEQKFVNYANQNTKTESVGMDRIREMMNKHQEKRK